MFVKWVFNIKSLGLMILEVLLISTVSTPKILNGMEQKRIA